MRVPLAVAGEAPLAHVDEFGYLHFEGGWRVEWWVGGDDHWHVPAAAATRRQRVVDNMPVVETVIRVPGGDVAWHAAAAASAEGGAVVAEFHNTATIPVAIGIAVVAPEDIEQRRTRPAVHFTAPARSVASDGGVDLLVHPVSHGSTWRCSVGVSAPDALPPIEAVVRGWQTLARRGASIATGDSSLDDALAVARTSLLVHAGRLTAIPRRAQTETERTHGAAVASALALLGYDDEAEALRVAARLRPRRRGLPLVTEIAPKLVTDPFEILSDPSAAASSVAAVRALLVDDAQRRVIDVLPGADASWRGRSIDVSNLPTNAGELSFALRWHSDAPALLWDAPRKVTLRAAALDATWSSKAPKGEELVR